MDFDFSASWKLLMDNEDTVRRYVAMLSAANARARLTGPSDEGVLWDEHVADCAAPMAALPADCHVVDVGTGGGLPGVVWAVCRPDISVTLLDSVGRKCDAVREMCRLLGLPPERASVICERSEVFAARNREFFDVAAARAVASSGELAEYLSPLVHPGGVVMAFKGPKAAEELEPIEGKWGELGLSEPESVMYGHGQRVLVIWEKLAKCKPKYPRKPGVATKRPWYA